MQKNHWYSPEEWNSLCKKHGYNFNSAISGDCATHYEIWNAPGMPSLQVEHDLFTNEYYICE